MGFITVGELRRAGYWGMGDGDAIMSSSYAIQGAMLLNAPSPPGAIVLSLNGPVDANAVVITDGPTAPAPAAKSSLGTIALIGVGALALLGGHK